MLAIVLFVVTTLFHLSAIRSAEKKDANEYVPKFLLAIVCGVLTLTISRISGYGIPKGSWRMNGEGQTEKVIASDTNYESVFVFTENPRGKFRLYEFPTNDIVGLEFGRYHSVFKRSWIENHKIVPANRMNDLEKSESR